MCSVSWTITSNASWLSPSSKSGSKLTSWKTLTINAKENTTGKERVGVLSFKIGKTEYATLTVKQPANDYIEIFKRDDDLDYLKYDPEKTLKLCDGKGDTYDLYAWSNDNWNAVSNSTWITVDGSNKSEGLSSGDRVKIKLTENTDNCIRTGTITVTCGKATKTITVTQVPCMEAPTLISPDLSTSHKSPSSMKYDDMILTWNAVEGAVSYKIEVDPADKSILLQGSSFESYINIINDDGRSTYSCIIPKTAFSLNAETYDHIAVYAYDEYGYHTYSLYYLISTLDDAARINGSLSPVWNNASDLEVSSDFVVYSTNAWTAVSNTPWISINKTNGKNGDTITVSLLRNYGDARTGTVSITVGNSETVLTVNQYKALPEYPGITFPVYSQDKANPTVISPETNSITVKWDYHPQAEYNLEILSFSDKSAGHIEYRSGTLHSGEYTFNNISLTPGQLYYISIMSKRTGNYRATSADYYFTPAVENAFVNVEGWSGQERTELEFEGDEDYCSITVESSGVWTASVSDDWIMVGKRHISQSDLDENGDDSSDYSECFGSPGSRLAVSTLYSIGW